VGVDMGRNIWQHDHPVAMITAVRAIVHEGATPKEGMAAFEQTLELQRKRAESAEAEAPSKVKAAGKS
jgi:hypothetical protein